MRLLILTQKVDTNDDVLGFFHRWIIEFAKHCESVTAICLEEGEHALPRNVRVFSLGKETRQSNLNYILKFYWYIWRERKAYDVVFVHMNPEYVVLGGLLWKVLGKKIVLWYNHAQGSIRMQAASVFSHVIFHTSPHAYARRFKKAKQMGAGIDTTLFKRNEAINRKSNSILSLGRISPVKNVHTIIEGLIKVDELGSQFSASIYGNPTKRDDRYYKEARHLGEELMKKEKLSFHKGVSNNKASDIFNSHEVFVNMTPGGSFDKTVLEAAATEMIVITCNKSFKGIIRDEFIVKEEDTGDLQEKVRLALSLSSSEKKHIGRELRNHVVGNHDVGMVVEDIYNSLYSI